MRTTVAALALLIGCQGTQTPPTPEAPKVSAAERLAKAYTAKVSAANDAFQRASLLTATGESPPDAPEEPAALTPAEAHDRYLAALTDTKMMGQAQQMLRNASNLTQAERQDLSQMVLLGRQYAGLSEAKPQWVRDHRAALLRSEQGQTELPIPSTDPRERWELTAQRTTSLRGPFEALVNGTREQAAAGQFSDPLAPAYERLGLTAAEFDALASDLLQSTRPLYEELHTWLRYELSAAQEAAVPATLPVHWGTSPLGDRWSGVVDPVVVSTTLSAAQPDIARQHQALGLAELSPEQWKHSEGSRSAISVFTTQEQPGVLWTQADSNGRLPVGELYQGAAITQAHLLTGSDSSPLFAFESPDLLAQSLGHWAALGPSLDQMGTLQSLRAAQQASADPSSVSDLAEPAEVDAVVTADPLFLMALDTIFELQHTLGPHYQYEKMLYKGELSAGLYNSVWWSLNEAYLGLTPPSRRVEHTIDPLLSDSLVRPPLDKVTEVVAKAMAFHLHQTASSGAEGQLHTLRIETAPGAGELFASIASADQRRPPIDELERRTGTPLTGEAMAAFFQPVFEAVREANADRRSTLNALP